MKVACASLPALPLQVAWRQHPTWRSWPVVVVAEDRPQSEILWACERARAARILPGQRYAHALGACSELRAHVLEPSQLAAVVEELSCALSAVAPRVEPYTSARSTPLEWAGTFWLDGSGLERLYQTPERWAQSITAAISQRGFRASVVVGTSRFATYAIARSMAERPGTLAFSDEEQERMAVRRAPLARLELPARLRESLARLGVHTLGQLLLLPDGGMLERFGPAACELVQLARGERWDPLTPAPPPETLEQRVLLDDEEHQLEALVFLIKGALDRLLAQLAARHRAVAALHLELRLRPSLHAIESRCEKLCPAESTLDGRALLRLVHLRLEGAPPQAGVVEVRLRVDDVPATREQLSLFAQRPARDLRAANEALSKVRAELGNEAVVIAQLRQGHLPEACFGWEALQRLPEASARAPQVQPLVRRIFTRAVGLPAQATSVREDGWMLSGLEHGSVTRIVGPFVISGGWWAGEVHREYHFADTKSGDCLWVYYDLGRRRWVWQGAVE